MKTDIDPDALYWASHNSFEFRIPGQAILDICHGGSNQEAVDYWSPKINRFEFLPPGYDVELLLKHGSWDVHATRNAPTPAKIIAELKEHGTWEDDELGDDATNWSRIIWIAAWNIFDDEEADCSLPVEPQ